jgi:uncharacterized membrane protein SirB2
MDYTTIRLIHIGCAATTISLFLLRGGMALANIDWRRWPPLRWLPHLNDTLLLTAAITLAVMSGQYPLQQGWLTAKVCALLLYIGLGRQALRPGQGRVPQAAWFVGALAAVGYIVAVAVTKRVLPW